MATAAQTVERRFKEIRWTGLESAVRRHATHLREAGYDIRTVQELLGHRDVRTTMTYFHVLGRGALGVKSPLNWL